MAEQRNFCKDCANQRVTGSFSPGTPPYVCGKRPFTPALNCNDACDFFERKYNNTNYWQPPSGNQINPIAIVAGVLTLALIAFIADRLVPVLFEFLSGLLFNR